MSLPVPIYCQDCGRANGASAKKCLWCGVPIIDGAGSPRFETTKVELEYLGGIERLDDPTPVKLIISIEGIELTEIMPGSRMVAISASAIIGAQVVDASTKEEGGHAPRPWYWWIMLGPFAMAVKRRKLPDVKKHDYLLTIKYKEGDEIRNAVFHREDSVGLTMVTGLAKIINSVARLAND